MMEYMYSMLGRTTNLCLYKYSERIPIVFSRVHTLTLIQCSQMDAIVQPSVFPNLKTIHYLSAVPTQHVHMPNVTWVFPSGRHPFYQGMVEAGIGRVDDDLIARYIASIIHVEDGIKTTLWIPDYGMIDADVYHYYVNQYIRDSMRQSCNPHLTYHATLLKRQFMKQIMAESCNTLTPSISEEDYGR